MVIFHSYVKLPEGTYTVVSLGLENELKVAMNGGTRKGERLFFGHTQPMAEPAL